MFGCDFTDSKWSVQSTHPTQISDHRSLETTTESYASLMLSQAVIPNNGDETMSSSIPESVQPIMRRVAITIGLGYLLLISVPVTTPAILLLIGGQHLVGLTVLSVSVVLTIVCFTAIGVSWLLLRSVVSTLDSVQKHQRFRVLRWAEAIEETHWWGQFVRPADRLGVLEFRSAEEQFEDELTRVQTAYVSGELSDIEFERRLDRQFGIVSTGGPPEEGHRSRTANARTHANLQSVRANRDRTMRGWATDDESTNS